MAGLASSFNKGDRIRVIYDKTGEVIAIGEALHTRHTLGYARFQVWVDKPFNEGWAYEFNLNYVTVEVL